METESSNTAHTESEPNSGPVPKTGTESEIRGMRTCLQRWAKEVEAETAGVCLPVCLSVCVCVCACMHVCVHVLCTHNYNS